MWDFQVFSIQIYKTVQSCLLSFSCNLVRFLHRMMYNGMLKLQNSENNIMSSKCIYTANPVYEEYTLDRNLPALHVIYNLLPWTDYVAHGCPSWFIFVPHCGQVGVWTRADAATFDNLGTVDAISNIDRTNTEN